MNASMELAMLAPPQLNELTPEDELTKAVQIIDFAIIFIVLVIYLTTLFMICKRRELQPLKVKNYKLIFLSVFASGLLIISNMTLKIIKNYMHDLYASFTDKNRELVTNPTIENLHTATCLIKTCHGCIFAPMMLIPYFFRALKLKAIFDQQILYTRQKIETGRYNFKRREKNLCVTRGQQTGWLLLILAFFISIYLFLIFTDYQYQKYFPLSGIQECIPRDQWLQILDEEDQTKNFQDYRNFIYIQVVSMLIYTLLFVIGLLLASYKIRNIPEEFSMIRELAVIKIIIISQIIVYIAIVMFIYTVNSFSIVDQILDGDGTNSVLSNGNYLYIISAFQLLILFETGVRTLYQTYKPNNIVPFPISLDVISSFQQAILMPLPTNHFYLWLESLPLYEEGLIIFGLHTDISLFNKMVEEAVDGTEEDLEECRLQAIEIFEDYIVENCRFRIEETMRTTANMQDDLTPRMSSLMDQGENKSMKESVQGDMSIRSDNQETFLTKFQSNQITNTSNDISMSRRPSELETFDKFYGKGQAQLKIKKNSRGSSSKNFKNKQINNNLIQMNSNVASDLSQNHQQFFSMGRQMDDTFAPNPTLPPEILNEIRAGYVSKTKKIRFNIDEGLFSDLFVYTSERLKTLYEDFLDSGEPFERLKNEVVSQEVLYEILKRYDLINI